MTRTAQPRLPFTPLLEASGVSSATVEAYVPNNYGTGGTGAIHTFPAPIVTLAELLGVTRRTVNRWTVNGVPLRAAEDACDALGLHPCEVWGNDYTAACLR